LQNYAASSTPVVRTKTAATEASRIMRGLIDLSDNEEDVKSIEEEWDHYILSGRAHWKKSILEYWQVCHW
jgi:hypothetical protein